MIENTIITQMERYGELDNDTPVHICDGCDEGIYEGEEVWELQGEIYCRDCIEEMKEYA